MKEINTIGNLPKPLQVLAKEINGQKSTLFFECESDKELLILASDGKCEETTVIMDRENDKGFMTAFGFIQSQLEDLKGEKLIQMKIYFVELKKDRIEYYRKMLSQHRHQQEDQMIYRRNKKKMEKSNDK